MTKYEKITDRKIKIALVGCGRIAKNHLEAISLNSADLELMALCDTDPVALESRSKAYGVRGYSRMEEMLKEESLDLVSLCTPSGLHSEQSIMAAHYGVSAITEKPMATKWRDGKRMVKAFDDAGLRLFVVKQNRLNPTMALLRQAVREQRFGRISLASINVFWTRPQAYYDQAAWRGTWEFDGGALMNQASHYIDLIQWLLGPIESIHCTTSTHRDIEVEDTAVLTLRWRHGGIGSVNVTMLTYPSNQEGSITILGDKGSAKIGGVALNRIELWKFSDNREYDNTIQSISYTPDSVYGSGHQAYYGDVVDTLRSGSEPRTDGREGLKSLEILTAAYISARDSKAVSLPLDL